MATSSTSSPFKSTFVLTAVVTFSAVAAITVGTDLGRQSVDTRKAQCQVQMDKYEASLGADAKNVVGECR